MLKVVIAMVSVALPAVASASVLVYNSYAAITAAGVVPTTFFVAPPPSDYGDPVSAPVPSPFALGPVRFYGSDYLALEDDYATYLAGSDRLTIATPPSSAVGLYYGSYYGGPRNVFVNGQEILSELLVPFQQIGFIGFLSDVPIASIVFTGGETDIERGFLSAVPEPATWLQLIIGFGFVSIAGRRKRRSPSPVL